MKNDSTCAGPIEIGPRDRVLALLVAIPGALVCAALCVKFMLKMQANGLNWVEHPFYREHYAAVGRYFSQGFAIGFFFCLCLVIFAAVAGTWFEQRRKRSATAGATRVATGAPPVEGPQVRAAGQRS